MKKIVTLFAALICMMSVSAKTVYLVPGPWNVDGAKFSVYSIKTNSFSDFLTSTDGTHYEATIADDTQVIFVRHDGSATTPSWDNKWNQTADLDVPADKNCYTVTGWGLNDGTWSVYSTEDPDPGTGGDDPKPEQTKYYITGTLAGGWDAAQLQLTENNGVWSHTFTDLPADSTYKFKITNGTWDKNWGADAVKDNPNVYKDADGNAVFDLVAGDVTVSFDGSNITVIGNLAEVELPVLVYNVTVPEGTKACYIAGAMNGWSQQEMTKVDDTHYTISIKGATTEMKYKYCSGPSWDYEEVTADGGKVEDRVYSENDVVAKWKAVYNPAGTDPGTDPTEIKYVLMGVGGDWANGIDMTANPDNADEYMLLGQTISEGDSVKVVRLEDGVAKHWCGNVKDGCKELVLENTVNDNIVLAPGVYDFYYDVEADQIWIATSVYSAIDNVAVEVKAIKVIRNGQMYILRDGVMYNALGQMAE